MKLSTPEVSSRNDGTRCVRGSARVAGATRAQTPTYIHPAMPYTASAREISLTTLMPQPPRAGPLTGLGPADADVPGETLSLPFNLLIPYGRELAG